MSEAANSDAANALLSMHAVLMVLGWGLLLPSGVLTAIIASLRAALPTAYFSVSPPVMFKLHRGFQCTGVVVVLTAAGTMAVSRWERSGAFWAPLEGRGDSTA